MVSLPSFASRKSTSTAPLTLRKTTKVSSGLDFSDGRPANFLVPLTPSPDSSRLMAHTPAPPSPRSPVRKNLMEQSRLQGLMRSDSVSSGAAGRAGQLSKWQSIQTWMVNEGDLASESECEGRRS